MKEKNPSGSGTSERVRQSGKYDKIWREKMQSVLPGIIEKVLGINMKKCEDLPHKVQVTQQREADWLSKVTDESGHTFILHLEIQAQDDSSMIYRMLEYRLMAERIYDLPVKQYVLYLGEKSSGMSTILSSPGLYFEYTLIDFSTLSYRLFLSSKNPEEKLLAILADFEGDDPEHVLRSVIVQVINASNGSLSANRYLKQLRIIIQLRSLAIKFDKAMESVASFFKEENDPFYIRGERIGLERGMTKKEFEKNLAFTQALIRETEFDDTKVAGLVGVTKTFVGEVRKQMQAT